MKLNLKTKTIISITLFVVIFVALILVASFCDWQVSELLTKGVLKDGSYFANDFFGVMLESVGCIPIYLMIAFILCVLFWSCLKLWDKKPYNVICAVICAIGVVVACWIAIKDSAGYIFEHARANLGEDNIAGTLENFNATKKSAAVYGVEAVFALIMGALAVLATMHFNKDTLKKLLKFSLATAAAVALANILIMIIKDPVGRMRFRAINTDLGQNIINSHQVKGFTGWWVSNGQPSKSVLDSFANTYGVDDAFKSFPSGHTCSAGTVYALIMIPTLFEYTGKKEKLGATIACWAVPIVYTMLVAISRIMVGAHYMSDVTFGGTLSFVCMIIAWEVFICKGSHFFALFPKLQKAKAAKGGATEEGVSANAAEDSVVGGDINSVDRDGETVQYTVEDIVSENKQEFASQVDEHCDTESFAEKAKNVDMSGNSD